MKQPLYPNIPEDAFNFLYGSEEWEKASDDLRLDLSTKKYQLLKNVSNKIPDKNLLNTATNLKKLPDIIKSLRGKENRSTENEQDLAIFETAYSQAREAIADYMIMAFFSESDVPINKLKDAKAAIDTTCSLGLPKSASSKTTKDTGVGGIADTVRSIVYDWYGENPPHDWLVTYVEIAKRHNEATIRPAPDDLKKYLKKLGFANLPDCKQG